MSYMTQFDITGLLNPILEITGNAGVPVLPVAGNVNIVGADLITTTGAGDTLTVTLDNGNNGQVIIGGGAGPLWADLTSIGGTIAFTPGANTLNLEVGAAVATSYDTDSGIATPALGVLNIVGTPFISTTGAGSTVTIDFSTRSEETAVHAWNGSILETAAVSVTSDGVTITFSVELSGGGDLTIVFSDGYYDWDTTPPATVTLTAGSDTSPQINYVYLLQSTKVLTVSTVGWPVTEHAPLGTVLCQSAASLQIHGAYKVHAWTDHVIGSNNEGHMSHIGFWIRNQNATWLSGVSQTLTITPNIGVPDNVIFTSSSGVVLQLHEDVFPAFGGTPDIYTVNDFVTPYNIVTDLNALLTDSAGVSMAGRYFSLVIWGVESQDQADCKLMVNLPSGSYGTSAGIAADSSKFVDYTIPSDFKGTGFLIAQYNLRHQSASGGTWTLIDFIDLRGFVPSTGAGSSTASGSVFVDNVFRIVDEGDDTKKLAFQVSPVATATTRTITMADRNIDLANVAESFLTGAGSAVPVSGVLTITGGTGITTSGAGSTVTITNSSPGSALTITGNSGGALTPTAGNWNIVTAKSTVLVAGAVSTFTMDFGKDNLLLGSSGSAITTGNNNVCLGNEAGQDLTTGEENTLIGWTAGRDITTSQNNTGVGSACLWRATTNSEANVAIGQGSLSSITANANNNTGCGTFTFFNLAGAANYNVGVGYNTGAVYTTTESNNILLNHWGVLADSNTLRIGFGTGAGNQQLNKAYISGIDGVNVGSVAKVVTMASDQLGTATVTAGTGITVTPGANLITITNSSPGSALTITGNSGGALTPTAGNWNLQTAGATAKVVGAVSTFTLDFAIDNLILGSSPAGITTATNNVGLGIDAALSITSATNSVFVGEAAGRVVTTSSNNTGIGYNALTAATTNCAENTSVGGLSLATISTGSTKNTAVGTYALISLGNNASYNTAIGWNVGALYTGAETSNVLINHWGVAAESNTLRIGFGTGAGNQQLNKAYISGIDGVNVGSVAKVVTMASDQLGTATITAGTAISVTAGANTITVAATGLGAFAWTVITGDQTAVVNNGYICNKAGTLALALPATGAIGDIIEVTGINTATGWQITQAANQQIFYGASNTTLGATGTLTSAAIRDSIRMVCVVAGASTVWNVISGVGTPTFV